jgi:hypothetical protein
MKANVIPFPKKETQRRVNPLTARSILRSSRSGCEGGQSGTELYWPPLRGFFLLAGSG